MTDEEFVLRLSLLGVGLVIVGVGAVVKCLTRAEMTPLVLMAFGALCIITATQTEPT